MLAAQAFVEGNLRRLCAEVLPALKGLSDKEYRGFEPAKAAAE